MKEESIVKKPITLVREDFINSLLDMINNSGLPYFVVESILKDFINEVHIAAQKQSNIDKIQYDNLLKSQSVLEEDGD